MKYELVYELQSVEGNEHRFEDESFNLNDFEWKYRCRHTPYNARNNDTVFLKIAHFHTRNYSGRNFYGQKLQCQDRDNVRIMNASAND